MHWSLDILNCRPRVSGDPYAVSSRCGKSGMTSKAWWLWVPAFAGTTTECVATTKFHDSIGAMVLVIAAITIILPATAQDLRGKDVNLYVGSGAGGPYDAYARL